MAWTDLRNGTLSSLNNLIGLRSQEKENARDRNMQLLQQGLGTLYDIRKTAKQREFESSESEKDRQNRMDVSKLQSITGPQQNAEFADILNRRDYPDGSHSFTTMNGKTYRWKNNQEYELVLNQMREDAANEQIRLRSALDNAGSKTDQGSIKDTFATNMSLVMQAHPDIWQPDTGWAKPVTEEQKKPLMQEFTNWLNTDVSDGTITKEDIPVLQNMFSTYLSNASGGEEKASGQSVNARARQNIDIRGMIPGIREPTSSGYSNRQYYQSPAELPEGITTQERDVYARLLRILDQPKVNIEAQQYKQSLQSPGTWQDLATIDAFLKKAGY